MFLNLDEEHKEKKRKDDADAAAEETGSSPMVVPAFDPSKVEFECEPSVGQQVRGVMSQVVLLFLRNKLSFMYVIGFPIIMSTQQMGAITTFGLRSMTLFLGC